MVKEIIQHKLINKNSNFFLINYWWGHGLNKNTQRPCPDWVEAEKKKSGKTLKVFKKATTYAKMTERMIQSCVKNNVNYYVSEIPEFAEKGGYQKAINYKPTFIKDAMKNINKLYPNKNYSVFYIDNDMVVHTYPTVFDLQNVDFMAYMWNAEPRQTYGNNKCMHPWLFETSGGIQFFANTLGGKRLVDLWKSELSTMPGKADDRVLSMVFIKYQAQLWCRSLWLPFEYLYFGTEVKRGEVENPSYKIISPAKKVVSHPECLTSEEASHQMGADKDRVPDDYKKYINWDNSYCENYDTIYEDLIFDTNEQAKTFSGLRKVLVKDGTAKVESFGKGTGHKYIQKTLEKVENMKDVIKIGDQKNWIVKLNSQYKTIEQDGNVILCKNEKYAKMATIYLSQNKSHKIVLSLSHRGSSVATLNKMFSLRSPGSQFVIKFLKSKYVLGVPADVSTSPILIKNTNDLSMFVLCKWLHTEKNLGHILRTNPYVTLLLKIN